MQMMLKKQSDAFCAIAVYIGVDRSSKKTVFHPQKWIFSIFYPQAVRLTGHSWEAQERNYNNPSIQKISLKANNKNDLYVLHYAFSFFFVVLTRTQAQSYLRIRLCFFWCEHLSTFILFQGSVQAKRKQKNICQCVCVCLY